MAPRPLEPREAFVARLRRAAAEGRTELRFGAHHFSHAACLEAGTWRVRRLEYTREEADARRAANGGRFMPEDAEDLGQPRTLVFEAPTLDALIAELEKRPWPL